MLPAIQFFLPVTDSQLADLPIRVEDYWPWQAEASGLHPYWGRYHWTLQTWLYLKLAGLPVELVNRLPEEGIVITHIDCLKYGFKPSRKQFLVALLVDREVPHPYAQFHVTHNPFQKLHLGLAYRYIPPWPQVGLIPRNPSLGDRFEKVGYFGYPENLNPRLKDVEFHKGLSELELSMVIPMPADWNNFSDVDVVLAVRNFGSNTAHLNKPALKLYNAWMAGIPAILGFETAFRVEGRPSEDYLEATSVPEVLAALRYLKKTPENRVKMVSAGKKAIVNYTAEATIFRWSKLIRDELIPRYREWQSRRFLGWTNLAVGRVREGIFWRRPGWF